MQGGSRAQAPRPDRTQRIPATSQTLGLLLDRAAGAAPLYQQIREGVEAARIAGTLPPGTRLPPERELAAALGVNRTTIMRAYQELAADGLVEARPGRGTVVLNAQIDSGVEFSQDLPGDRFGQASWLLGLPSLGPGWLGPDPGLLRDLTSVDEQVDVVRFGSGSPGAELIPQASLLSGMQEYLTGTAGAGLGYAPVEGMYQLRLALREHLAGRGVVVTPEEIMVVSGATQGLSLVARALIEPGDTVVVEAPTYIGVLQNLATVGARLIGVPTDSEGLRVDVLARVLAAHRVRLIVVQPTFHNPTGAILSPERRARLLTLAHRYGVPILEDDAYGEIWHSTPTPPPLKALDREGMVVYLGTFSKTVAPGLRVGWLAARVPVIRRLTLAKQFFDLSSNSPGQAALIPFLTTGAYETHLSRIRAAYAERRAVLLEGLRAAAPYLDVEAAAPGGFYLWCRLRTGRHARLLAVSAARAGVALVSGEAFYPPESPAGQDGQEYIRLSYAGSPPAAIAEGIRRLLPLLQALPSSSRNEGQPYGLRPFV